MKICLLSRNFSLKGGGIGRVGAEIRDKLREKGHEVHTIETKSEGLVGYGKYTLVELPFRIPKGMDVYHAITPMESIWIPKAKGVSVILDIIALTHPNRYGGRLGYGEGKGVVTFHDIFTLTNPKVLGAGINSRLKKSISKTYFRFACEQAGKCKYVVTVSEHVRQEVIRHLRIDESKVRVIKSGIRDDLVPYGERSRREFIVGYLGQLDKRKRVDLLIEAFKKSSLDKLVIGGVGLEESALKRQSEGDSRVNFLGLVPDEKLVQFYNNLDVFVFPTAIEGYGLPPVEAMACKKPVIVLSDAIIPQEVKSRCVIVDELKYVLGNRKYLEERCGQVNLKGNYDWAKEHNWDRSVEEYIGLYEELVSG